MTKSAKARFAIFIVIHTFLCYCVVGYSIECFGFMNPIDYVSDISIDGSDFTRIANMFVGMTNGVMWFITSVMYIIAMLFFTVAMLIPFCLISIRKQSDVTRFEELWTKRIIIWGSSFTYLISILFTGIKSILFSLILMIPALLIELLLYWMRLKKRKDKN